MSDPSTDLAHHDGNFYWFSPFMYSRVEKKLNYQKCIKFVICYFFYFPGYFQTYVISNKIQI